MVAAVDSGPSEAPPSDGTLPTGLAHPEVGALAPCLPWQHLAHTGPCWGDSLCSLCSLGRPRLRGSGQGTLPEQVVTLSYRLPPKAKAMAQSTRCPCQQVSLGCGRDSRGGDRKTRNTGPPVGLPNAPPSAAGVWGGHCAGRRNVTSLSLTEVPPHTVPERPGREAHSSLGKRRLASLTEVLAVPGAGVLGLVLTL